jgi:hypothetical protein
MVEAIGLETVAFRSPLQPTKFHENLPVSSEDIRRSLIPEASNAFSRFYSTVKHHLSFP